MKNPNGYGTIKKLSGNRRRPFVFMVSVNGKQKAMGYFSTKLEALAFQVDYNQSHSLHRLSKLHLPSYTQDGYLNTSHMHRFQNPPSTVMSARISIVHHCMIYQ